MGILQDEILKIKNLPKIVEETIRETVQRFDHVLIDFVANKQMDRKGEDGEHKKLGNYSLGYARIRIKRNLQVEHIDLHFSGKFHASIEVFAGNDGFTMKSDVEYDKKLEEKYGPNLVLVQDEYLKEFTDVYLAPAIIKNIYNELTRP